MTSRVLDSSKTKEMCDKEVEKDSWSLAEVPDHFKTQEMCNKAVQKIHALWGKCQIILNRRNV